MSAIVFSVIVLAGCASSSTSLTLTQAPDAVILTPMDVNANGDAGDVTVFETPILKDGEPFGVLHGTMTKVSALEEGERTDREERMLAAVFDLPDGQISVMGISYYVPDATLLEDGKPVVRAIVGGTGAYLGVKGEVATTRNADNSYTHELTINR